MEYFITFTRVMCIDQFTAVILFDNDFIKWVILTNSYVSFDVDFKNELEFILQALTFFL